MKRVAAQLPRRVDEGVNILRRRIDRKSTAQSKNVAFRVADTFCEALSRIRPDIGRRSENHACRWADIADQRNAIPDCSARIGEIHLIVQAQNAGSAAMSGQIFELSPQM